MRSVICSVSTIEDREKGMWVSCVQLKMDKHYAVVKQESVKIIKFPYRALCQALLALGKESMIERFRRNREAYKVVCKKFWD